MSETNPLSEKQENILSALAHGSIVAQGLGIAVGVILYITQRDRSERVAFQALQAAVYQLIGMLVVVGTWMVWFIFYMATFIPMMQQPEAFEDAPPPLFWVGMLTMIVPMALTMLLWAYGLLGAIQTLRGRDFRYLVLGRLLNKAFSA